jgi:hypothetical protein
MVNMTGSVFLVILSSSMNEPPFFNIAAYTIIIAHFIDRKNV